MKNELRLTKNKAINLNQDETLFVAKFLGIEELEQSEGIYAIETNMEIFIFTKYETWNYVRLRKTDENRLYASNIIDRYYEQYGGTCHILPQKL